MYKLRVTAQRHSGPASGTSARRQNCGCKVKGSPPIKVVRAGTNGLLKHLLVCEGREVWLDVRAKSRGSLVYRASDGKVVTRLTFKELLPHHARFVIYCFLAWDKFSKTRSPAFKTYIQGWEVRARLPHRETCIKLLFIIKHLIKNRLYQLLAMVKNQFGSPTCGLADDIWSKRNCKQSFACARIPMSLDGDLLDSFCKATDALSQYSGKIHVVSCSPVLAFSTLPSSRHTGHVIKRWKEKILKDTVFSRWPTSPSPPRTEQATTKRATSCCGFRRSCASRTICSAVSCLPPASAARLAEILRFRSSRRVPPRWLAVSPRRAWRNANSLTRRGWTRTGARSSPSRHQTQRAGSGSTGRLGMLLDRLDHNKGEWQLARRDRF